MSSRVLRRLREKQDVDIVDDTPVDEDEDYEESKIRKSTFAFIMNDESESESESESEQDTKEPRLHRGHLATRKEKLESESGPKVQNANEDFDSILSEFHKAASPKESIPFSSKTKNSFSFLLDNIDRKDFDLDFVLRNMMNGIQVDGNRKKRKRGEKIFCQPRSEWGKKPETFVGGGLGMECLMKTIGETVDDDIPWPYNHPEMFSCSNAKFFRFHRSNEYANLIRKYDSIVSNSGDINTLAMFISDYPFVVEPLFQFSMFLFSVGENDKGIGVLKRCLWIMECAAFPSLFDFESNDYMNLMDFDLEENQTFFNVLFRYAQTSCALGCASTSCAVGRFLLSLDPVRDPCGILLVLDYYALASRREKDFDFVIELVRSELKVCYKNFDGSLASCDIICMPNWAFSYSLALFWKSRLVDEDADESSDMFIKACQALRDAINAYPFIPELLLQKNNVDIQSRTLQMDWKPVITDLKDLHRSRTNDSYISKISSIFVNRSYQLWNGDDVLKWLFEACQELSQRPLCENVQRKSNLLHALRRYESFDPIDFTNSFRQIPQDLNPLDPGLADAALNYTPNRRRFLRIDRRNNRDDDIDLERYNGRANSVMLGTSRSGMDVIDPGLPIVEVFWRSFLPWARVDGV